MGITTNVWTLDLRIIRVLLIDLRIRKTKINGVWVTPTSNSEIGHTTKFLRYTWNVDLNERTKTNESCNLRRFRTHDGTCRNKSQQTYCSRRLEVAHTRGLVGGTFIKVITYAWEDVLETTVIFWNRLLFSQCTNTTQQHVFKATRERK